MDLSSCPLLKLPFWGIPWYTEYTTHFWVFLAAQLFLNGVAVLVAEVS